VIRIIKRSPQKGRKSKAASARMRRCNSVVRNFDIFDITTLKPEIQNDIREMSELIGLLSVKYSNDPLLNDIQKKFLGLSAHAGRALDIQLQ
jgi:hypothetical protein